jgi:hypothetical protein
MVAWPDRLLLIDPAGWAQVSTISPRATQWMPGSPGTHRVGMVASRESGRV